MTVDSNNDLAQGHAVAISFGCYVPGTFLRVRTPGPAIQPLLQFPELDLVRGFRLLHRSRHVDGVRNTFRFPDNQKLLVHRN